MTDYGIGISGGKNIRLNNLLNFIVLKFSIERQKKYKQKMNEIG